jgi:adenosylcobyric acid synthase
VASTFLGPRENSIAGYELHLGETRRRSVRPFAELTRVPSGERVLDGAASADGLVVGTYVHGLFADERSRSALFARLGERDGLGYAARPLADDRFAALSAWFRSNVDLATVLSWVR